METANGPVVLEVNSSPGFEGIERATGLNIAKAMVAFIAQSARKHNRSRRKKRR
jgi:ribosomal protein S6--L-glutamate ligase